MNTTTTEAEQLLFERDEARRERDEARHARDMWRREAETLAEAIFTTADERNWCEEYDDWVKTTQRCLDLLVLKPLRTTGRVRWTVETDVIARHPDTVAGLVTTQRDEIMAHLPGTVTSISHELVAEEF